MDNLDFLFAGFAVFWAGLFGYLLWLQARIRTVTRELEHLEERLREAGRPEDASSAQTTPTDAAAAPGLSRPGGARRSPSATSEGP